MYTTSSIKAWRTCRRLYRYRYIDLVRPARVGKALSLGTAVHAGLEAVWRRRAASEIMAAVTNAIDCASGDDVAIEQRRAVAMVRAYVAHWGDMQHRWAAIEVEGEFSLHLDRRYLFGGKRDALARHAGGGLYLIEHKTTSDDIADVGCDYWHRLSLDVQLAAYQESVALKTGETPTILYDVIRKPLGSPKLKERIVKRKGETDEDVEARKAACRETLDEFEARLYDEMIAVPDSYLVRREIHRTREQHRAIIDELCETIGEIDGYRGLYPRNDDACRSKFGACPYLGVCAGTEQLDSERFVKVDSAHTELSTIDDEFSDCPL